MQNKLKHTSIRVIADLRQHRNHILPYLSSQIELGRDKFKIKQY